MAVLPRYFFAEIIPTDGKPLSRMSSNRTVIGSVGGPK